MMKNNSKEAMQAKAEFKQQFMNAIGERFTPEEMQILAEKMDLVTENFVFQKNAVQK